MRHALFMRAHSDPCTRGFSDTMMLRSWSVPCLEALKLAARDVFVRKLGPGRLRIEVSWHKKDSFLCCFSPNSSGPAIGIFKWCLSIVFFPTGIFLAFLMLCLSSVLSHRASVRRSLQDAIY